MNIYQFLFTLYDTIHVKFKQTEMFKDLLHKDFPQCCLLLLQQRNCFY